MSDTETPSKPPRCPNCDLPLATEAQLETAPEKDECAYCWSEVGGECTAPPVDWRARCLAVEAYLEALVGWASRGSGRDARAVDEKYEAWLKMKARM